MAKRNVEVEFSLIDGVSKGLGAINKGLGTVGASLTSVKGLAVQAAAAFGLFQVGKVFTQGVESAATFEQSLDKISAKTGVTGEALQQLGADIRAVAQEASKTGADGAAAFERLTSEGLSAADALKQLPTALDFATASSQGTAEAVGSLSDNLDAFGLGADSFARAADVITAGALRGGTGVADLQKALQAVGPTARDLGLTLEQTTAALGTLAQNGLEGGKAGKALAAVFDQLRDPSSKFREELAKIGIASKDFNTVLTQLAQGGTKTQAALNSLGTQGTNAIKALTQNGGASLAAFNAALQNVEGQTGKTAATINQGLIASFTRLKESADAALSTFLQPILGPLADEFDALATQINEFAASPAFEDLKTNFKAAFVDGLDAVKKFIAEFDFKAATAEVQAFVKDAGAGMKSIGDIAGALAASVKLAASGIAAVFNSLKTVVSGAVAVITKSLSSVLGAFDAVASRTQGLRDILDNIGSVASNKAGEGFADLTANVQNAGRQIDIIAGTTDSATESLANAVPVLQQISEDAFRVAENARVLADAEAAASDAATAFAREHDAAATSLGNFGDAAKLAAENAATTADISAKSAAAFKETQKGIADEISARKKQASAVRDVADAADEAAQSMEDFQAATAADAGYSDAVFAALGARIDAIAPKIAALAGVSEASIRDGVNKDTQGAIRSFTGMNSALEGLEARFAQLGGDTALAEIKRQADAAAEAVAQIGPNARAAAADLDAMVRSLQDAEAARSGDQASIEQRRFEEELARIAELERVSGGANRAAADLARQLAKKEHEARLAEIAAEGKARVDSELGADAAIKNARGGQSATGAPAGGGGGLGASPSTTDNSTRVTNIKIQGILDPAMLAKILKAQEEIERDKR